MSQNKKDDHGQDFLKSKPMRAKESLFKPSFWISKGCLEAAVLVNLKTGVYYTVNPTAETIWLAIDGKRTVKALAAKVARKFSVSQKTVLPDILLTLRMFEKNGLVRRIETLGRKS